MAKERKAARLARKRDERIIRYVKWVIRECGEADWKISVSPDQVDGANAAVFLCNERHEGIVHFGDGFHELPETDQIQTITHEAMHMVFWRETIEVQMLIKREVGKGPKYDRIRDFSNRQHEIMTDRLAEMFLKFNPSAREMWAEL